VILGASAGFVLRTWPLREADRIVSIYTEEEGKVRGVAHGATRPKSKWAGALDPLTEVHVEWRAKDGQDLVSLRDVSILFSPYHPSPDLGVSWTLAFLAELLDESTAAGDPDATLYRLVRSCSAALTVGTDPLCIARYFEAWVLRLAGLLPDLSTCAGCSEPLGEEGGTWHWSLHGIGCTGCLDQERSDGAVVLAADLAWLDETRRLSPAALERPEGRTLPRVSVVLRHLLREFLGKELNSARFLDELERLES
jgi:DNA repair protein RecO (recombination protein O)